MAIQCALIMNFLVIKFCCIIAPGIRSLVAFSKMHSYNRCDIKDQPCSVPNQGPQNTQTFLIIDHVPSTCASWVPRQQSHPEKKANESVT